MSSTPGFSDHSKHCAALLSAVWRAADSRRMISDHLSRTPSGLRVGERAFDLGPNARLSLIAVGKAAAQMANAAHQALGERIDQGLVVVPTYDRQEIPERFEVLRAGHPQPDQGSLQAGASAARMLAGARPDDLLLALISGGGSAMFELLVPGITLADLQALNSLLLACGAPIQEINTVRGALSQIKSGGLARLSAPGRVAALLISDVVGDQLSVIASGPTVLRTPRPAAARAVIEKHQLINRIPPAVWRLLERPPQTPLPARRPYNFLVGSNRHLLRAAADQAAQLGFAPQIISARLQGEARLVGAGIAHRLERSAPARSLIWGGESTVTLRGSGRGGRNQELALSAALALSGQRPIALMTLASDGVDGFTDAAGAIITHQSAAAARELGLDPQAALANNDSHPLLDALGALIRSGPSGTNLNDLVVGLTYG